MTRLLRALAVVPVATGLLTIVTGTSTLPDRGVVTAAVESELRFYATWWVGAGLFLWWIAPSAAERPGPLRAFCALLALGGCARLVAAAAAGWPPGGQVALMVAELVLPLVLLAVQARARSRSAGALAGRSRGG